MKSNQYRSGLAALSVWMLASTASASAKPRYQPVAVETRFKRDDPARIERVKPELERGAIKALEDQGIKIDETSSTRIVFQVVNVSEEIQPDKAVSDYGTHIEVQIDGEKVGYKITGCQRKGEAELIGCALSGLPEVMHLIPQEKESEHAEPPGPIPQDAPTTTTPSPRDPWGIAGISVGAVVAATGLGFGIAGAVDLSRGTLDSKSKDPNSVDQLDHSQRGAGFLIVGGVALAAGVALIAVGVARTKKQREKKARVHLDASPNFAGLRLTGRF